MEKINLGLLLLNLCSSTLTLLFCCRKPRDFSKSQPAFGAVRKKEKIRPKACDDFMEWQKERQEILSRPISL